MANCKEITNIDIIPFEPCFQEEVVKLFVAGISTKTDQIGKTINSHLKWYKENKLSENEGDMFNIWESFMKQHPEEKQNVESTCKYFWVAIDKSIQRVVGHIGVIMSTYDKTDQFIYYKQDLNPSNVCELVRMGVHEGYRGKHIGKRLFETLEVYAAMKGMKQIALSTLDRRELACRFYEGVGFKLVHKNKLDLKEILGPGDWEDLHVVHYVKLISKL